MGKRFCISNSSSTASEQVTRDHRERGKDGKPQPDNLEKLMKIDDSKRSICVRIRAHLSWRTGKHLHVLHVLRTYPTCSYPGYQDTTTYTALYASKRSVTIAKVTDLKIFRSVNFARVTDLTLALKYSIRV